MKKLRALGEAPKRVRVSDGDTWRVLTGHFETLSAAEPILEKLQASGFEELWVATETRPGKPRKGRALYAVTERFERRALPLDGVAFAPQYDLTKVEGKGRYRGRVEMFPNAQGRLTVVNELDMETYLRGVVPKEMGAWEYPALEALKAQAIAARTYAYSNRGKRAAEGFDLLDTVSDQVYGGRDGEQTLTDRAVAETSGLVATFNGKPIQALFMATGGGATVDNTYVFGGDQGYLKGVSSYAEKPLTLPFKGAPVPKGDQGWLTLDLLRLAALDLLPLSMLEAARLAEPLSEKGLLGSLSALCQRLELPRPKVGASEGSHPLIWMARALGFHKVVAGQERPQDAAYFLGSAAIPPADRLLAAFLTRRGLVPAPLWDGTPTLRDGLLAMARMAQELEPVEFAEGTLLKDGQVRRKGAGPEPFPLADPLLLAEEAPGGALRWVSEASIQVGDRLRWLPRGGSDSARNEREHRPGDGASGGGGARLVVRRLDPDGASFDRYNPTAHWKVELKESELVTRLRQRVSLKGVAGIELEHNDQGRVLKMTVRDEHSQAHVFTGMRIRAALGLKDNVFRYLTVGKGTQRRWIFYGRGWGHGVGMDQTGAYGMALEGSTFEQILKHYYTGIELTKAY